ncbi:anthranilate phosphoribosyltransferase [Puttea exsequens]|nr:anthranilate phosphoribosyltransferase [Puttea exsequens]
MDIEIAMSTSTPHSTEVSITSLLKRLHKPHVHGAATAEDIATAFALIFQADRLSPVQAATFLTLLSSTSRDKDAYVIAACAAQMRDAAAPINIASLMVFILQSPRNQGNYHGGLCDIVGTGGSPHQTYNISTTASLIASSFLLMSKHGNKAQTSVSGAADILSHLLPTPPRLEASNSQNISRVYERCSYAFLYAPNFHPGMRFAGPLRREMGIPTIFNLLGPLAHPIEELVEARVVGVAESSLGPVFAEALRISGKSKPWQLRKAMVVAGEQGLDEISCAGRSECWMVSGGGADGEGKIEYFELNPSDFGFSTHQMSAIRGGEPKENAEILMRLLEGRLANDDPILQVVLMNAAAMFVVSGICESDLSTAGEGDERMVIQERGPGRGRWKEGVRRARWAVESGAALKNLETFIDISNQLHNESKQS